MTVPVNSRRREYQTDGVARIFNGPMAYVASYVKAYLRSPSGAATEIQSSAYSVERLGRENGTRVIFFEAPAAGFTLILLRVMPYQQDVDITNQGAFLPETVEKGYDDIVMQLQQLNDLTFQQSPDSGFFSWDALGLRIRRVGAPTQASDASNKQYVDDSESRSIQRDEQEKQYRIDGDNRVRDYAESLLAGLPSGLGTFLQSGYGALPRTFQSKLREVISVRDFGAKLDGSDDTQAFTNFLSACSETGVYGVIDHGILSINPIALSFSGDLNIRCDATIQNRQGSSATARMLSIVGTASGKIRWNGGIFDSNMSPHTGFNIEGWGYAQVYVEEAFGIECNNTSSAPDTSLIRFHNNDRLFGSANHLHGFHEGNATQGSIPRAVTVQTSGGRRCDHDIHVRRISDGHCGVTIGLVGGGIGRYVVGVMENLNDNGFYNVSDASHVYVDDTHQVNTEEPVVHRGSGEFIWTGGSISDFSNSIGVQSAAGMIRFRNCVIESRKNNSLGSNTGNIFKSRVGNSDSAGIEVRNCSIYARTTDPVVDFGVGVVRNFIDEGNTWDVVHDSSCWRSGRTDILNWSGAVDKHVSNGSIWALSSITGDLPTGDYFMDYPAPSVYGVWDSRLINSQPNSSARIRISTLRRQNVHSRAELFALSSNTGDCEANRTNLSEPGPRVVWGSEAPTTGYWARGSRVENRAPSASGVVGWICTLSGTPGTWRTYGTVS